ncbi:MAG: peptide deformylase [Desulfatitalea sp.]|nr:peptide deformylase [Desulfatitalea sp.]
MSLLDILTFPDEFLKSPVRPVENIDGSLQAIIDRMAETMYHVPGVGLAAIQVGLDKSLLVYDIAPQEEGKDLHVLINPKIIAKEGQIISENEGCLSVPDYRADVPRAARILVEGVDREGKPLRFEADGMVAIVLQHEIDHLNGTLFIGYLRWRRCMQPVSRFRWWSRNPTGPKAVAAAWRPRLSKRPPSDWIAMWPSPRKCVIRNLWPNSTPSPLIFWWWWHSDRFCHRAYCRFPGWALSTSTPRCCPSTGGPRPSSGPCSVASAIRALPRCSWTWAWIPVISFYSKPSTSALMRMPINCTTAWPTWAPK